MKIKVFFVLLLGLITAVGFMGCEGEMGPQGIQGSTGPQGPQGPQGPAGADGADGADGEGTQNCMECHGSNQLITAKVFQWENSVHALGGHSSRNSGSCTGCHSSQGFLAREAVNGGPEWGMDIEGALQPNCYTCHQIHTTYTSADWAMTYGDPVDVWVTGQVEDLGGTANQCLNCHQPRVPSDGVPAVGATGDYTIESSRYGPHHGPQGTLLLGVGKSGAYEVGDGYTNSFHTNGVENACVNCHMATVVGSREAGGHTFRVEEENGDINPAGCVACHDAGDVQALVEGKQAEIQALLDQLGAMLEAKGIKRAGQDRSEPGTYDAVTVGAYYNYIFIVEDQSRGVHNPKYATKLLENSIAALQ